MRGLLQEVRDSFRINAELAELLPTPERKELLARMRAVSRNVPSPHNESHILAFVVQCLRRRGIDGVIVEAGCFKGSSTAKISLVASLLGKELIAFDSFRGLPPNTEPHDTSIFGQSIRDRFRGGSFAGSLEEVRANVTEYGEIGVCRFVEGWFEDTMPLFDRPVAAAYLDVDLASSTRACLTHLYPLLAPGGVIVSQDGDFPLVIDVLRDETLWSAIGCADTPRIAGLGKRKIVTMCRV